MIEIYGLHNAGYGIGTYQESRRKADNRNGWRVVANMKEDGLFYQPKLYNMCALWK